MPAIRLRSWAVRLVGVLSLAVLAAWSCPAAADAVAVRVGVHEGYGRMVFDWPAAITYETDVQGRQMTVRFDRPIEADLAAIRRSLSRYVTGARIGEDGRSVVLTLSGDFDIRHFYQGAAVVVDLQDRAPERTSPVTATAPRPAAPVDGRPVSVRVGEHEGFSRIVVDWPDRVGYRIERNGGLATIRFDRPARFEVSDLAAQPPRYVRLAAADNQASSLTLEIPETSRLRDSLSNTKVVLDIYAPDATAAPPPPNQTPPSQPIPSQASTTPPRAAPPVAAPSAPESAPNVPPVAIVPDGKGVGAPVSAPAEAGPPVPESAPSGFAPGLSPPANSPPSPPPDNRPLALTPPAASASPTLPVSSGAVPAGASGVVQASLQFGWSEPVAAAVFRRGDALWVVFDKAAPVDEAALRKAGGNLLRGIEQLPVAGATVLRLDTVSGVYPGLRRDGMAWIVEFRQQATQMNTAIEVRAQTDAVGGPRVFLPVTEPARAIAITDPEAGDNLVVVPLSPLSFGMPQARRFPQFELVETVQGIVVKPLIDELRVRSLPQGVELTVNGGLAVSTVAPRAQADLRLGALRPLTRLFDLEPWRNLTLDDVRTTRQSLQMALAKEADEDLERHRLDIARFHLAMGFQVEALAVVQTIEAERPEASNDPEIRAIRGVAQLLMGRREEAAENLKHESIDNNDEGDFWRAALMAEEGDMAGAAPILKRTTGLLRSYPRGIKFQAGLRATQAAIAAGDVRQAAQVLETLRADTPRESEKALIDYEIGRVKELAGDFGGAVASWESAMASRNRLARAKAAVARAELQMKTKEISRKAGIAELEKLRFAWRGDDFEFDLLRRLGDLYLAEGDVREALRTLRQAATYFRGRPAATEVAGRMAEIFSDVFLGERIDELAPLTAISLYEEFKELTPPGEKGDTIIRRLADRLVVVDLLDQAAALLDSQVQFRLQGIEKARVGAQVALVRLMAREPEQAVGALKASETPGLPEDLARQRRHLMARSLAGTARGDEALALLKGDAPPDAEQLRLEILWNGQRWAEAAGVLRRIADSDGIKRGVTPNPQQAQTLLNMAVALTLSGNQRAVNRLRDDFLEGMDATPYKEAFRLIASDETQGLADYRTIAGKVKLAENFQGFMAAYKERLKAQNLSGIN